MEAQIAIDRALGDLVDGQVGIWWRTLACELELEILALAAPELGGGKRLLQAQSRALDVYAEGTRLIRLDHYRQARLADLALDILQIEPDAGSHDPQRFAVEASDHLHAVKSRREPPRDPDAHDPVETYVAKVEERLENLRGESGPIHPVIPNTPLLARRTEGKYQSVFISYGAPDLPFAERLRDFLERKGVTTWWFPRSAVWGERIHRAVHEGIQSFDRVLLICSERSLPRAGVLHEIELTLAREAAKGGGEVLLPISLDRYVYDSWKPAQSATLEQVKNRVIGDFDAQAGSEAFEANGEKILHALLRN
jgi:hypothetical protein